MAEITQLLHDWADGDAGAFDRVVPLVYEELRLIARRQLRGRGGSIDTTGLVHELYLKIAAQAPDLANREHLMALSSRAMRHLLVSRARKRTADKRGGQARPVSLDEMHATVEAQAEWMIDLDRALEGLREHDERLVQTFECRYFGGLSEEETAKALGTSLRTSQRDWQRARAWLRSSLEIEKNGDGKQ